MGRFEVDLFLPRLQPVRNHNRRPANADQQAIGAGHVGHGERSILWILAGHDPG